MELFGDDVPSFNIPDVPNSIVTTWVSQRRKRGMREKPVRILVGVKLLGVD